MAVLIFKTKNFSRVVYSEPLAAKKDKLMIKRKVARNPGYT